MHVRTIDFADWLAVFFTKLREPDQTAMLLYRNGFPFSTPDKAAEFQRWFAALKPEIGWGDCGQVETDFEVVRFHFPNQWLAEKFEWRHHGRVTFLDGTLEAAPGAASDSR